MRIFVIEDNPIYAEILSETLNPEGEHQVEVFSSGKDAIEFLKFEPEIITLDYALPDMDGSTILKKINEHSPESNVIVVSGQEDVSTAIQLLNQGAYDYITKDNETQDRLKACVRKIAAKLKLEKRVHSLEEEVTRKYNFHDVLIGKSKSLERVFKLMGKAATTNINVSITGETGTGKELVAKSIHYNSKRASKDFVAVNVAAIPSELIESELFGHEKGAFTGAQQRRIGKFEEADGGTIFLDEIGEMDMNLQAKLLRVLQEKEVMRIGSNQPVKIDVRVITATHRNLEKEIEKGDFREDLYFRLMGLPIHLPPLRERDNDILFLSNYFIEQSCEENELPIKKLSAEAQEKLIDYNFPGNVRELKAMIELAVVMSEGGVIHSGDLKFFKRSKPTHFLDQEMTLKEYNARIIQHYLEKNDFNILKVAKKLDVGKSTLYRMVKSGELEIK